MGARRGCPTVARRGLDGVPDGGARQGPDGGLTGPDGGLTGPDGGLTGPDGGLTGPDGVADRRIIYF
jgi:hypothetical protein